LYEKSKLFLVVALDTRDIPLSDPSLCDLLKNGISDGGDYIFCINLMNKYGVVPTDYYPNSSYGAMSTEAVVTLLNEVLRENTITLRRTGNAELIKPMLANIFTILCMSFGEPPMPWKTLDWHLDQHETMAQFAGHMGAVRNRTGAVMLENQGADQDPDQAPEGEPEGQVQEQADGYPVEVPEKGPEPHSASVDALLDMTSDVSSVRSDATAAPVSRPPDVGSSISAMDSIQMTGTKPPRPTVDILPDEECPRKKCPKMKSPFPKCGKFDLPVPEDDGTSCFFTEALPKLDGCRLFGKKQDACPGKSLCRLAGRIDEMKEETLLFQEPPKEFYHKFLTGTKFIPLVCDMRYDPGTRIFSNDANMCGGLPSVYLNVTIQDLEDYAVMSLKRNVPVWFACDVKKQLTPEGGRMCSHMDRLGELLPMPHERGPKLEQIKHYNAIANHALLITAVSMDKDENPTAWRIVNSWGDIGRYNGIFVACGDWFRDHVYSINAIYDTLSTEHKADIDFRNKRPTVRLGPFDPSVI
jgi:aminopeptidase C